MRRISKYTLLLILLGAFQLQANTYYVSKKGNDNNPGTKESPYRTISKAVKSITAGDTCYIREGIYRESIKINGLKGTAAKPILLRAYGNEKVVLDGSEVITTKWEIYKGQIYRTKLKKDIWQLFVDGKSMTSARWPNGNWYDGSVWDKTKSMAWPEKGKGTYGQHYNKELENLNFDLTGGIIIVNSGSFRTYASHIMEHAPGTDHFKYDITRKGMKVHFSYKGKTEKHGYFLEGKLGLLDEEREWFYDSDSKYLYVWFPDGKSPDGFEIKGKTQSYAFNMKKSSHIKLEGFHFFGTTFRTWASNHITIENCQFLYPSYSKRMLNDLSPIEVTAMEMEGDEDKTYNTVRNCTFEYMDGPVLDMNGWYNVVENNYMHSIDYSCTYKGGYTLNMSKASGMLFRRNTVHTTGASELYKAGVKNTIELNDLSHSGFLQNDGSMVQVSVAAQDQSETRYNWVHNTVKQGLRFDNSNLPNSPWGENGSMHHNVAWETDRIFFKGDKHFIYNNLSFDSHQNDLIISSNREIQGRNDETITRNNISNKFSGHRTKPGKDYPVPGIVDHNWAGNLKEADIRTQLRDPDNLDFRPKKESDLVDGGALIQGKNTSYIGKAPDIGAYEYGAKSYWIPGFQGKKASRPIPPNESSTVKQNADLMWLKAYKSVSSNIFFGTDNEEVLNATEKTTMYKGNFKNNIYTPGKLISGRTYHWRVDAIMENGAVIKGDLYTFTVE